MNQFSLYPKYYQNYYFQILKSVFSESKDKKFKTIIAFHENKNKLVVEYFNIFNEEKKLIRLYETSSG